MAIIKKHLELNSTIIQNFHCCLFTVCLFGLSSFGSAISNCVRVISILIQVLYQRHQLEISPALPQICLILLSILLVKFATHNLYIVHYNVQSIFSKLEILHAKLFEFDILAFTETWLGLTIDTDGLILQSYYKPERKDRDSDTHVGYMLRKVYTITDVMTQNSKTLRIFGSSYLTIITAYCLDYSVVLRILMLLILHTSKTQFYLQSTHAFLN